MASKKRKTPPEPTDGFWVLPENGNGALSEMGPYPTLELADDDGRLLSMDGPGEIVYYVEGRGDYECDSCKEPYLNDNLRAGGGVCTVCRDELGL